MSSATRDGIRVCRALFLVDEIPRLSLSLSSSVVDDDPPLSLSRRHLSSATGDGIRVCRSLSLNQSRCQIASATRNGIRVCRARSLSLVEGRHVSSAMRHGIRVSRSLNLVVVSSATRQGIRVSRALSLSSTRDGWVCSCALSTDGDETWNPRLSLVSSASASVCSLRGAYTKIPSLLRPSSVIFTR